MRLGGLKNLLRGGLVSMVFQEPMTLPPFAKKTIGMDDHGVLAGGVPFRKA